MEGAIEVTIDERTMNKRILKASLVNLFVVAVEKMSKQDIREVIVEVAEELEYLGAHPAED